MFRDNSLVQQNNDSEVFRQYKMLSFNKTKVAKEEFYDIKKSIKIWDIDVDNIAISKLI